MHHCCLHTPLRNVSGSLQHAVNATSRLNRVCLEEYHAFREGIAKLPRPKWRQRWQRGMFMCPQPSCLVSRLPQSKMRQFASISGRIYAPEQGIPGTDEQRDAYIHQTIKFWIGIACPHRTCKYNVPDWEHRIKGKCLCQKTRQPTTTPPIRTQFRTWNDTTYYE